MSTTNIEVWISDIGENAGTIGWLLKQPIKIHIGACKHEKAPGCWLKIGDKTELVAIEGYSYNRWCGFAAAGGINKVPVIRSEKVGAEEYKLAYEMVFTDAAWAKVCELLELAREQFRTAIETRDEAESKVVANFAVTKV